MTQRQAVHPGGREGGRDQRIGSPDGGGSDDAFEVHDEVMSLTLRLVGENPDLPAGSVMRCVARAVRRALMAGTPREQIPALAEDTARRALAGRHREPMGPETPQH
jgi:hypothetical protein